MRALILGALLFCAVGAEAQVTNSGCVSGSTTLISFDFEQITVSTSSIGLTASKYAPSTFGPAIQAVMVTETDSMRVRTDGPAPTSSVGLPVAAGGALSICQGDMAKFRAIRSGSSDVTLNVLYLRPAQ